MNNKVLISSYLDKRNVKQNGKCTLKLRVYQKRPRKQKLFATSLEFTPEEYDRIITSKKLNSDDRQKLIKINKLVSKADEIRATMRIFDFDEFERKMGYSTSGTSTLKYHYDSVLGDLKSKGSVGTANSYEQSYKSLSLFFKQRNREIATVDISEIVPRILEEYKSYMTKDCEKSETTVGIYLRALRAVLNYAVYKTGVLLPEQYPFGKGKFQIPTPKARKMALGKDNIKALFNAETKTEEQKMAKDFWFFSYFSNGMNIADIVSLKYKDIKDDCLHYARKKTIKTVSNAMPIEVHLNDFQKNVIKKYGTGGSKNDFIFNIISSDDGYAEQYKKRTNFTRFINQHIQQLLKANDLQMKITTYTARHTYVTNAILNNAGIEFVQQALGHSSPNTTNTYIASLGFEKTKEVNNQLMNQLINL